MKTKAPTTRVEATATETTLLGPSDTVEEVAFETWRSSPNKHRSRLLSTRLDGLTVGDLLRILEDLDRGRDLAERGLL